MDFKQLNEELRNLEASAGKESSDALLQIIEFKMSDFKTYIDQRFSSIQWMMGIGFTLIALMMAAFKFIG